MRCIIQAIRLCSEHPVIAGKAIAWNAIAVDASAFVESSFRAQKERAFQASSPNDFGLVRSDRPFFCPAQGAFACVPDRSSDAALVASRHFRYARVKSLLSGLLRP
jgi:hypothetical protein